MNNQAYELNYSYQYAPTLKRFNRSNKRIKAVLGPFGSGKSSACVMELFQGMCNQPSHNDIRRTRYLVVRNTYKELLDTTIATFFQWLPPVHFGKNGAKGYNITRHQYTIDFPLSDGTRVYSEIFFRALDRAEDISHLLSLELTGAWINEYREIPLVIFDGIDGRIDRFPPRLEHGAKYPFIILDSNPPDYDHWSYTLFEEKLKEDPAIEKKMRLFRQPSGLSPKAENLPYLPEGYYTSLATGKSKEYIQVYIDGEYGYVKSGKPVFPNYSDALHLAESDIEPVKGLPIIIGADWGLSPAVIFTQFTPNGHFNILRELVSKAGTTVRAFFQNVVIPVIQSYYAGYRIIVVGDPSGVQRAQTDGSTCFKEVRNLGLNAIPAKTNSLQARISAVDSLLSVLRDDHKPALRLSPSCAVMRKGFMGEYKYPEIHTRHGEMIKESPLKNEFSHPHDALQYAALGYESIESAREMEGAYHAARNKRAGGKSKEGKMKGFV